MAKVQVQTSVEEATFNAVTLLCGIVVALKAGKSITEIAISELADLEKAVSSISQLPAEFSDDPAAMVRAVVLPASDLVAALLAKPAPKA